MKKISLFLIVLFSLIACRDVVDVNDSSETLLESDSELVVLMEQTSMNDGSVDNILDNSSCFKVKLPVTVIANGNTIVITTENDYNTVEFYFDESDTDDDKIEFVYPITLINEHYNEIIVDSESQFRNLTKDCNDENIDDDDIECVDFVYPINVSVYNIITDRTEDITIVDDSNLNRVIQNLKDTDNVSIVFPVNVVLSDGSTITTNNFDELRDVINQHKDDCDEDDDNDYNDDDCADCTPQQIINVLEQCNLWTVDRLEINKIRLEDNYLNYTFHFSNDGTITIQNGVTTYTGTWSVTENIGNIVVAINIPLLPVFNNSNWVLGELNTTSQSSDNKVDLRNGDDRLRFESDCN